MGRLLEKEYIEVDERFLKMKKSTLIVTALFIISIIAGCASKPVNINIDTVADKLKASVKYDEELQKIDAKTACNIYDISDSDVVKQDVYIGSGATVDEISVWQAKDESSAKAVKDKVLARVASQKDGYQDYKPEELPKLDTPVIASKGCYVVLCITKDTKDAQKIVDSYFK